MSLLKKIAGKGVVLFVITGFVVFGSGCIVLPHDYGYHRGGGHHDHGRYERGRHHHDRHRY